LLQQPIALEGVYALFEYVLHHLEATGPILLKLGCATKMAVFWSYFRDFVRAQKIENLSESKTFFMEVFQITRRFVLAKKFGGLGAPQC